MHTYTHTFVIHTYIHTYACVNIKPAYISIWVQQERTYGNLRPVRNNADSAGLYASEVYSRFGFPPGNLEERKREENDETYNSRAHTHQKRNHLECDTPSNFEFIVVEGPLGRDVTDSQLWFSGDGTDDLFSRDDVGFCDAYGYV